MDRERSFDGLRNLLAAWTIPSEVANGVRERARESLDEVKALIDHFDNLGSRMLTVVAFLTAAASFLFQRFAADHAWPKVLALHPGPVVVLATYVVFITFVVLVAIAARQVFGALVPRFTEPSAFQRSGDTATEPYSPLFYKGILSVCPEQWGAFFEAITEDSNPASKRPDKLDAFYAKSSIFETYLVASDVEKKVAAFNVAIKALGWALWALIAFLVLFFLTIVITRPDAATLNPTSSSSRTSAAATRAPATATDMCPRLHRDHRNLACRRSFDS